MAKRSRRTDLLRPLRLNLVSVSKLTPWKENPRRNSKAIEAVAKSIQAFGFNVPIVCDEKLRVIAGHTRRRAALQLGLKKVPVLVVSMGEVERQAFAIADNQTASIADWDTEKLSTLLERLRIREVDLGSLGFGRAELDALLLEERDFPWDAFDSDHATVEESTYALLPVKVKRTQVPRARQEIARFAARKGIRHKDNAVVAGFVLMAVLGGGAAR